MRYCATPPLLRWCRLSSAAWCRLSHSDECVVVVAGLSNDCELCVDTAIVLQPRNACSLLRMPSGGSCYAKAKAGTGSSRTASMPSRRPGVVPRAVGTRGVAAGCFLVAYRPLAPLVTTHSVAGVLSADTAQIRVSALRFAARRTNCSAAYSAHPHRDARRAAETTADARRVRTRAHTANKSARAHNCRDDHPHGRQQHRAAAAVV